MESHFIGCLVDGSAGSAEKAGGMVGCFEYFIIATVGIFYMDDSIAGTYV
jgi:hypothetical protein